MKATILATVLCIGFAAHAGTEIGYSQTLIRSKAVFNAGDVRSFAVDSASVKTVASQTQTVTDSACMDQEQYNETPDYSRCQKTTTLAKTAVVKITVSYQKVAPADADAATGYVELALPQSSFTAEQISAIKANGMRADRVIGLNVKTVNSTEPVVDEDNSPSCQNEDETTCPPLVYKNGVVRKVIVTAQPK